MLCTLCRLCRQSPSPVTKLGFHVAAAVSCSQPSPRSRRLDSFCFASMHVTELPFSVLLLHLLDFLPLASAASIATTAIFVDVPVENFCTYVRNVKRTCRQKLAPLLRLGFNAPCLSFRHQPVLLWDPWLRPSECPWYGAGDERASVQREDEVEASVCQLACTYLGLPPQGAGSGIGAFQRFMQQDRFALCRFCSEF